jgi:hypothetical protein
MALLIDIKHPQWMKDEELRIELLQFYPEADIRTGDSPGNAEEIDMESEINSENGRRGEQYSGR